PSSSVQDHDRHQAAAQDALGQKPSQHEETNRGQSGVHTAGDDLRSLHPRRDHRGAPGQRVRDTRLGRVREATMALRVMSADSHMDLIYLPPDTFTSRMARTWGDAAPHVVERDGRQWWVSQDAVLGP